MGRLLLWLPLLAALAQPAALETAGAACDAEDNSPRLLALWGDAGLLAALGIGAKQAKTMISQSYYNEDGSVNPYPIIVSSAQYLQGECPGTVVDQLEFAQEVFQTKWPATMTCAKVLTNLGSVLKEFCTAADCDRNRFGVVFRSAVASFALAMARGDGLHVDNQQRAEADRWRTHAETYRSKTAGGEVQRKQLLLDVDAVLQNSPVSENVSASCDRVELESSADFAAVLAGNRPAVMSISRSASSPQWEWLRSRATLAHMNATMGDHIVPVSLSPLCRFATVLRKGRRGWRDLQLPALMKKLGGADSSSAVLVRGAPVHMAFSDALELLTETAPEAANRGFCAYLEYLPAAQWLPALFETALQAWDSLAGASSADGWLREVNLWLSSAAGAHSGLHYDLDDNIFYLVQGRKHFVVFPPEQVPRLGYQARADAPLRYKWREGPVTSAKKAMRAQFAVGEPMLNTFGSSFDPHESNPSSGSAISQELAAKALHCRVEPGELLYLPALWSHDVLTPATPEPSLGLNYWFKAQHSAPMAVQRFLQQLEVQLNI